MTVDYQYFEYQAFEYLIRIRQDLEPLKEYGPVVQSLLSSIRETEKLLKTRRFRVAVVGEFNKGKSSFINALLGREILPVDVLPMTATLNRITYGTKPKAYLEYKDGRRENVKIEYLSRYITKLTAESLDAASQIKEAVVEYPSIFCQNHVDLIDTPGLNDDQTMNAVTVSLLEQIDLAIVTLSPNSPFSDTEAGFMVNLLESPEILQIVIIVTKIDEERSEAKRKQLLDYLGKRIPAKSMEKLRETHEEGDPTWQKAERIFNQLRIFGVCSPDALTAWEYRDDELLGKSGFKKLNDELPGLILACQNNSSVLRAIYKIHQATRFVEKELLPLIETDGKARKEELIQERTSLAELCYMQASDALLENVRKELSQLFLSWTQEQLPIIRKLYIQRLASVQALNTSVIEQALATQSQIIHEELNQFALKELDPQLLRLLSQELLLWQQSLVQEITNGFSRNETTLSWSQEEPVRLALDKVNAGCSVQQEKLHMKFVWSVSPIPEKARLMDVDLIEHVMEAVKSSLSNYFDKRLQQAVTVAQNAATRVQDDVERLVMAVFDVSNRQMPQVDEALRRVKASGLLERFKNIEAESLKLEDEFYKQLGGQDE